MSYLKPIDLFLKHQKTKLDCLNEFSKIQFDSDALSKEYSDFSDFLDNLLENYDQENYLKKTFFINKIKSECIKVYKSQMDYQVISSLLN